MSTGEISILKSKTEIPAMDAKTEEYFRSLNAMAFIAAIRVPAQFSKEFDREATAASVGLEVEYDDFEAAGYAVAGGLIFVSNKQPELEKDLTVGHEIGHYFLHWQSSGSKYSYSIHHNFDMDREQTEQFCENFAYQLIGCGIEGQLVLLNEGDNKNWGEL